MGNILFLAGVLVDEAVMARFNRIINEFNCCSDDAWISSERDTMYKKLGSIEFKPNGFRVLDIASNSFLDIDIESYIECDYNINGLNLSKDALLKYGNKVRAFNTDSDCDIGFVPIICGNSLLEIDKTMHSDFRHITYASSTGFITLMIKIDFINKKYSIRYDSVKIVLSTVYVDRLRVLDLYSMTVYDVDAYDAVKNNTDILGFKHFSFGIDDKYITVNAGGLKYHNGDNSSSVALFYNNEVLIDFEKYNSSNIVRYEFNKSYHYGMGLSIYVDAETGKVAVCFNNEHLIYGDKALINSYNSAKSNIKYTVYVNYYKHTIDKLMPKICSKISDNAYMMYNGAVLLGCYSKDIEYNSFDDIVVPNGVTDVYFGYSDIADRISYFELPKSIKNVYSLEFFAPPSKLAFTLDKSVSLDIIKSLHKICLFGIGDLESKEDAITALKSGGVVINLV